MKFFKLLVLFCTFFALKASAQMPHDPLVKGKNDTIRVALTLVDNELIPWLALPEVKIVDTRIWRTAEQQVAYNRLRYNVLKVLPYAMYARSRYAQLQTELARTNNKKEQRILQKAFEKEVKDMFNNYQIDEYKGTSEHSQNMKDLPMSIAKGVQGFFLTLSIDLKNFTLMSIQEEQVKELTL